MLKICSSRLIPADTPDGRFSETVATEDGPVRVECTIEGGVVEGGMDTWYAQSATHLPLGENQRRSHEIYSRGVPFSSTGFNHWAGWTPYGVLHYDMTWLDGEPHGSLWAYNVFPYGNKHLTIKCQLDAGELHGRFQIGMGQGVDIRGRYRRGICTKGPEIHPFVYDLLGKPYSR